MNKDLSMEPKIIGKSLVIPDRTLYETIMGNKITYHPPPPAPLQIVLTDKEAKLFNTYFFYDKITNTSYIQNHDSNLVIRINGLPDSITIDQEGNVTINNQLDVIGNINADDINLTGNISSIDGNFLGDIISTNSRITNNLIVDREIVAKNTHITKDLLVDRQLISANIRSDAIVVDTILQSKVVETELLANSCNLNLRSGINHSINIPNSRSAVNICNDALITPQLMKAFKVFVVTVNTILNADETCDGIEIIICNRNSAGVIIVRDSTSILCELSALCSKSMIYISVINKWFLL